MQDRHLQTKRGESLGSKHRAGPGIKQDLHKKLAELYGSAVFMLKHPGKVLPVFPFTVKRLFGGKKYIFLLAAPTHSNRGDQMIFSGMKKWCGQYLPEYGCKEYDDDIYKDWSFFRFLKLVIKKGDILFLRGGGSVGDRYLGYEEFVRHVLESYPENKTVMFPQSVSFSDTREGEKEKLKTAQAYDAHPDFTLYARDETSYAIAKEMFRRAKVRLCPDIALFLSGGKPNPCGRDGVLFCLRNDSEIYYSEQERGSMAEALKKQYPVRFGDTGAGHNIPSDKREAEIQALLCLFSASKVAVTDRFHGVISAVLTGTPCVALRSADHKIVSGIHWFKDLDYVFFAENSKEVPALVEKAMRCEKTDAPDFSAYFNMIYEDIVHG